ncbi:MAG: hypothetical protein H6626_03000 [Pseudobdellovibrionaceae bacterium]|nr:hypothetical protein [Bdellovibrionales bacterium]USN48072.1 MAG: hypothetical protein H6626_03000 [Pseudobdellovibrionaceae bacterium]
MSSEARKQNQVIFNPKALGQSLCEMGMEVISADMQQVVSRWFHSEFDVDLFVWEDERKNIIKQQVCFCGQVVEWNIVEGIRTGFIIDEETDSEGHAESQSRVKNEPPSSTSSEVIIYDDELQGAALRQAIELLQYSDQIKADDRLILVNNFIHAPQMDKMNPKEVLKQFGKTPKGSSVSWWQKLLNFLSS